MEVGRDLAIKWVPVTSENRIDAVVIATPPQLHFPIAKAFLEREIDVICEKPMVGIWFCTI